MLQLAVQGQKEEDQQGAESTPGTPIDESVRSELDYWERLVFSFDMDRDRDNDRSASGSSRRPQRSRGGSTSPSNTRGGEQPPGHTSNTTQQPQGQRPSEAVPGYPQNYSGQFAQLDPYTLAQLAVAAAAMQQQPDPFAEMRRVQGAFPPGYPTYPSPDHQQQTPTQFQQPGMIAPYYPQMTQSTTHPSQSNLGYPFHSGLYSPQAAVPLAVLPGYGVPGPSNIGGQPPPPPQAPAPEGETDDVSIAEDKRRRNTMASARFRIKKKHKTLEMERSIADLEGRAGDLEREASDLRRENDWLKEMLIMKRRRSRTVPGKEAEGDDDGNEDEDSDDTEEPNKESGSSKQASKKKGKEKET
ncbi:hypothetical protein BD410DRAFT_781298 [Rickenella mellea]|uniref:BZIP domain-containing protein n=1 Tax=Rickenella mellea TaxID=50990 RepID=A0A4Y7QN11_9AGAM|nr:hypothetical protein BD410DRAFT_781298 [Rickenella mellea]